MTHIPGTTDLRILRQNSRVRYARLKVFDDHLLLLGEIQGDVTKGSITIDSSSDIRRTCSLSIHVTDSSYQIESYSKIWINRILKVEIGEWDHIGRQIVYYQAGVFVFNNTSYTYDATSHLLQLSCSDLMSLLNDDRGSQLPSLATQILYDEYGEDYWKYYYLSLGHTEEESDTLAQERASQPPATLNQIILDTLNQLTFVQNRYIVEDIYDSLTGELATVPYDLSFGAGATVYEVLAKIRDLYPGWEMFFDEYGFFVYRHTPDYNTEQTMLQPDELAPLVVSEQLDRNFNDIYNCTIVWGAAIETDLFIDSDSCSTVDGVYQLTEPLTMNIQDGTKFGFVPSSRSIESQTIRIVSPEGDEVLPPYPIKTFINNDALCELPAGHLKAKEPYVIKLMKAANDAESYYYLYGQYQIHGEFEEHNIRISTASARDDSYLLSIDEEHFIKVQECEKYEATIDGKTKEYTFVKDVYHIVNGTKLVFTAPRDSVADQRIKITRTSGGKNTEQYDSVKILNQDYAPLAASEMKQGVEYVLQMFQGIPILIGVTEKNSVDDIGDYPVIDLSNPFSVERVGRIIRVYGDGDYANIGTNELANQRAEYQTNLTVHFNDVVNLTTVVIPWIDCNYKIRYRSLNTGEEHDYLITNASLSLTSGTMTLNLSRLYNTFI